MRRIVAVIALGAAVVACSTVDPSPKLKAATSAVQNLRDTFKNAKGFKTRVA